MPENGPVRSPRKPLPLQEQEYRQGLYRLERRAIIPLKWVVLGVMLTLWIWVLGGRPTPPVVLIFVLYFLFNCFQTYFFFFTEVTIHQIKPLTLISYLMDVVFISMLIYFDLATPYFSPETHSEFYMLYFLLVMRGFALFKTIIETVFVNLLISILYILTLYLSRLDFSFLIDPNFAVSLIIIWLVILMSWLIVMIITRQKIELMEVQDRLLRADSLARVGELAAGVAHEINNPIGIIAATAEYLKKCTDPGDERLEELDAIYKEAMRCRDIVQEMLTYANPRPSGVTTLDPRALNDEVLHFVFPLKRQQQFEVIRRYDQDAPMLTADPNLIKQALLNLYINAKQAVPAGQQGRIVSRIQRHGGRQPMLRIEIEDNGIGIPDEEKDRIFEPFYTRKNAGTGLGLAVTQRIVEKFNGAISVHDGDTTGTVFTLDFPAARE